MSARVVADRSRALAIGAVLIVVAGYAFDVRPAEERIAAARSAERLALDEIARDERALAERDRIVRVSRMILGDLRGLGPRANGSGTTPALLSDIERLAVRDELAVLGIQPGPQPSAEPTAAASAEAAAAPSLLRQEFDLTLRGSFRSTVRFLADLSRLAMPAAVVDVDLDRINRTDQGAVPELDSSVRVLTVRLRDEAVLPRPLEPAP